MTWFKVATLEIYNLDKSVAMLVMKRGLRPFKFTCLLDKIYYKSYLELLVHTQKYILIEEGALT